MDGTLFATYRGVPASIGGEGVTRASRGSRTMEGPCTLQGIVHVARYGGGLYHRGISTVS